LHDPSQSLEWISISSGVVSFSFVTGTLGVGLGAFLATADFALGVTVADGWL